MKRYALLGKRESERERREIREREEKEERQRCKILTIKSIYRSRS